MHVLVFMTGLSRRFRTQFMKPSCATLNVVLGTVDVQLEDSPLVPESFIFGTSIIILRES
jgi:hypothetical protein